MLESLTAFVSDNLSSEIAFETTVVHEPPVSAVFEQAAKYDTQLIAIGSNVREGVDRLTFGSVTEAILAETAAPILIAGQQVANDSPGRVSMILSPVDLSFPSLNALRYAADLARLNEASLVVVHVSEKGSSIDEESITALCSEWIPEDISKTCTVHKIIRHGNVVQEILEEASGRSADLIVMGLQQHLFRQEALGEKAGNIIRLATCPIILVPEAKSPFKMAVPVAA